MAASLISPQTQRRRQRRQSVFQSAFLLVGVVLSMQLPSSVSFTPLQTPRQVATPRLSRTINTASLSPTALSVWWYGGSESTEASVADADSCELVPVRIERPTSSSRKIFGEIVSSSSLEDVWSILTDYDRLAIHVPNLKESRITQRNSKGQAGDGQFQCRLFQRGAQKIVGFEFGASVTMDMKEYTVSDTERRITFKCVDSMFFSEFDGEWKVEERVNSEGQVETLLSYVVVVKPNGPVPVAALEWRIREDVPTNLRAVKLAASSVTARAAKPLAAAGVSGEEEESASSSNKKKQKQSNGKRSLLDSMRNVQWYKDETMAAYLTE